MKKGAAKKLAGTVCILHGTMPGRLRCAVCEGYRANGERPGVECGCGNVLAHKPRRRFAFTFVLVTEAELHGMYVKHGLPEAPPGAHWMVGRADEGTRGYSPLPAEGLFEDQKAAQIRASELNDAAGWTDEGQAQMLVLSTMSVQEGHLERLLRRGLELVKEGVSGEIDSEEGEEWIEEVEAELRPRK